MLLLSVLLYWNSVRAVETLLRADVERDASGIAREVETSLKKYEAELFSLARSPALRNSGGAQSVRPKAARETRDTNPGYNPPPPPTPSPPLEVQASIRAFLLS